MGIQNQNGWVPDLRFTAAGMTIVTTAAQMLNKLAAQDGDMALRRKLKFYARPALLLIDEVVYLSNRHADLLFEIINRRYEHKSTLVTTNRIFTEWHEVFSNAACVVSLVDRLIHHAEIIAIDGEFKMCERHRKLSGDLDSG